MELYNIIKIDYDFMLDDVVVDVNYRITSQGVELTTIHNGNYIKRHYIDTYDDYYDEFELLLDLGNDFIEYIKKQKGIL